MKPVPFVVIIVLALAPLLGVPASATTGASVEWWGPTAIGDGHHLRVPVTVRNAHPFKLVDPAVVAEIDLGQALIDGGWVSVPTGDRAVLESFELDPSSIRVVAVTDLDAPSAGTSHGRLKVVDASLPVADLRRYEAPSFATPGLLVSDETQPFDARTNPIVTLTWRIPGTLESGQRRHFVVYFDSRLNPEPVLAPYDGPLTALLEQVGASGPGMVLHGYSRPTAPGNPTTVRVVGLHANTEVHVKVGAPTGVLAALPTEPGALPNPFTLQEGEVRDVILSSGPAVRFRLEATRPIVGVVESSGFVPDQRGSMLGTEFVFSLTSPASREQDTVYFVAGSDQPTVVQVESLATHAVTTYHLLDETNPYPYTIGARSRTSTDPEDNCDPVEPLPSPLLPAGNAAYRARVVSGGPVLLQVQPTRMSQVPAVDGGPAGNDFQATIGWTRYLEQSGRCKPGHPEGVAYAAATGASASMRIVNAEWPLQIDPPQSSVNTAPPGPRSVGAAPAGITGPLPTRNLDEPFRDRPLEFISDAGPMWLFSGPERPLVGWDNVGSPVYEANALVPALAGPLTGVDGARRFAGLGPVMVVALYDDTRVTARLQYRNTGPSIQTTTMLADASVVFANRGDFDVVQGFEITSTAPVLVFPLLSSATFLAGPPTPLEVTVHPADFRGYLIDLAPAGNVSPLSGSTFAGSPVSYEVVVTNLGRQAGGLGLTDTIDLDVPLLPEDWTATLEQSSVTLASGQSEHLFLTVTPPEDATPRSSGVVTLRATSRGNPGMVASLDAITFVKRSFDVGLWFLNEDGPKALPLPASAGQPTVFPLVVKNEGSTDDVVEFAVSPPDPGWTVLLLRDDVEVSSLALSFEETADLSLIVTPPADATDGILFTTVTASSASSPSALDRVVASTHLQAPSDLILEVADPIRHVLPGGTAEFVLRLSNAGEGSTEATLSAVADPLQGWVTSPLSFLDPVTGQLVPAERLSLTSGDEVELRFTVTAPADARRGMTLGARVEARPESGVPAEAFLYTTVDPVHGLTVTTPDLPINVPVPGVNVSVSLGVHNDGNLDEQLRLRPVRMPPGWTMGLLDPLSVPRGEGATVDLKVLPAADAGPGDFAFDLELVAADGNITAVNLTFRVGAITGTPTVDRPVVQVRPGDSVLVTLTARHVGNTPALVRIEPATGEAWTVQAVGAAVQVAAAGQGSVPTRWQVPASAPDGRTEHHVNLVFESATTPPTTWRVTATITFDVARASLAIEDVEVFDAPAGRIIHGFVANLGARAAANLTVSLLEGAVELDAVLVRDLGARRSAEFSLLQPSAAAGAAQVIVQTGGVVVARHDVEAGAAAEASTVASGDEAPGLPLLILLAGCVAAAWCRRR